ncbi:MAG TPA: S8 family serine peptidase, partial [Candidatus Thermoplasmatota archaeon]|nr:S8 family serine peptidase [Candidatus Thermoplasmatota archaeon]
DPEVTATYSNVVACIDHDGCTAARRGTSFATPLVAGMAARVLSVSPMPPAELEALLKGVARDTPAPPAAEGYGFLDGTALEAALAHAVAGTRPEPDVLNALYVETVQATSRQAWGEGVPLP